MKFVLKPEEMRNADKISIKDYLIEGQILMENAARSVSEIISELLTESKIIDSKILIFCGSGNNGGDGFAAARHLSNQFNVEVIWIGTEEKMSNETRLNFEILKKMKIPIYHFDKKTDLDKFNFQADIIIDALIGVGGTENLKGFVVDLLKKINSIEAYKIGVDVPSGLNAETGLAHPDAFIADMTITMFAVKTGMLLNDGIALCGDIAIASLGAPERIVGDNAKCAFLEDEDVFDLVPPRDIFSSKFDYGKILIIAGSVKMPGAAALCANSAIKSGAGLVYLMTTSIHSGLFPEVIPTILPKDEEGYIDYSAKSAIKEAAEKADVVIFGPGIGNAPNTIRLILELLNEISDNIPIILDADAIQAVSVKSKLRKNILLTPHLGEFAKLTGISRDELAIFSLETARKYAEQLNCTILLKNVPTIITNGNFSFLNIKGNPGMATAGSGDVLTGLIGALAGQKLNLFEAATVGAFLHSKAGDSYADKFTEISLTASSLIKELENIFAELT